MAKATPDAVLDQMFDHISATANAMSVCSQQPTTRAEAATTYKIADISMSSGDFTKANGDASGRKVTVAQQASVTIDATSTGNHVALYNASNLLYVTTCTSAALATGGTVTFPSWDIEIADPS